MDYYFNKEDSKILIEQIFEGTKIEPRFFIPNLPFLLINGSEGIGSGHAQTILPRNPEIIKQYIKSYLNGNETPELIPYWKGFKGEVKQGENNKKWSTFGIFEVSKRLITITELPVGYSLSKYLKILDNLVDKKIIKKYDDLSDTKSDTYKFIVQVDMNFEMTKENVINKLNLESKFSENYTSIDENNSIILFDTIEDILNAYIKIKLDFMKIRKENIINNINKSVIIARNKMLFIKGIVTEKFTINKKSKDDINNLLKLEKFDLVDDSYDYLLNMNLYSLTKERIISLKNTQDSLENELNIITGTSESDMWISEI
jgi:DNA topoisomerase-2